MPSHTSHTRSKLLIRMKPEFKNYWRLDLGLHFPSTLIPDLLLSFSLPFSYPHPVIPCSSLYLPLLPPPLTAPRIARTPSLTSLLDKTRPAVGPYAVSPAITINRRTEFNGVAILHGIYPVRV